MTVEIRPTGNACNLRCEYCYQNSVRDNQIEEKPNYEHFEELYKRTPSNFVLFGGEPFVAPIEVIEEAWRYGFEEHGRNSMQSNGVLITDKHIELMKKYNVHAGISIDGKEELNDLRWAGSKEKTREATKATLENIEKMINEDIGVSLIITLHDQNASPSRREKFKEWLREMDELGINSCRFHLLEKENNEADKHALTNEEYLEALLDFAPLDQELDMRIDKYDDVIQALKGEDNRITCVWTGCDPWHTSSVVTIDYNGDKGCGRPHKGTREWLKSDERGYERTIMLYETPQEDGGCKDCKYFTICKGQCAGTGINGDWRNRSEYCEVWKGLFEYFGEKMKEVGFQPVYERNDLEQIEQIMINKHKNGKHCTLEQAISIRESTKRCNKQNKQGRDGAVLTHNDNTIQKKHQDKAHMDHRDHRDSTGSSSHKDHLDSKKSKKQSSHKDTHRSPHKDHLDNNRGR